MRDTRSEAEICQTFDMAVLRLARHDIVVRSDDIFRLFSGPTEISAPETVDGLIAFADALDYIETSKLPPLPGSKS